MSYEFSMALTGIIVVLGVIGLWLQNKHYKKQSYNISKEFADKRMDLFIEYLIKLKALSNDQVPMSLNRVKSGILEGVSNLTLHYDPVIAQINKEKVDFVLAQLKVPVKNGNELFDILIDRLSNWR